MMALLFNPSCTINFTNMPEHEPFDPEGIYSSLTSDDWKQEARHLGLPEDSTKEDIIKAHIRAQAVELGLPETATQEDIDAFKDQRAREVLALKYGLPETASYRDIERAAEARAREQLRQDGIEKYGLPKDATLHDINVAMVRRLRERHEKD